MDDRTNITELLCDAPTGEYLLECTHRQQILWRISEGEPAEDALVINRNVLQVGIARSSVCRMA